MTDDRLSELRRLCEDARMAPRGTLPVGWTDAARTALPELLDEVERLRQERDEARAEAAALREALRVTLYGDDPDAPPVLRPIEAVRTLLREYQQTAVATHHQDPDAVWSLCAEVKEMLARLERLVAALDAQGGGEEVESV